jgi:hypothetical protein
MGPWSWNGFGVSNWDENKEIKDGWEMEEIREKEAIKEQWRNTLLEEEDLFDDEILKQKSIDFQLEDRNSNICLDKDRRLTRYELYRASDHAIVYFIMVYSFIDVTDRRF